MGLEKDMKKKSFIIGFVLCLLIILFSSSYSYRISSHNVDVRTVIEDGHKYVVAAHSNGGVSIIHSESCYCKK